MWTTASLALLLLAAPDLEIPTGKAIQFDGALGAGEWDDARTFATESHELRLKRTGPWLCVGLAGKRSYAGEIFSLTISDAAGAWQTRYLGMLGMPAQPPALALRATREHLISIERRARNPLPAPRGTLCRLRLDEPGSWSAEYRIRLPSLGIGRGDRREFRFQFVFANGPGQEPADILVLPKDTTPTSEVEALAVLRSPDGWGADETWEPVTPDQSAEYDDTELLGLLALEQQEALTPGETGQIFISTAVRPRVRKRIDALRAQLEAGRERNPTLPSWRYFLGRLLHESNLYDEAGGIVEGIPAPLLGLGAFAHLAAEHFSDIGEPEKALEICRANPRVHGMDVVFHRATRVKSMLAAEAEAEEQAKKSGAADRPLVRITTSKGEIEFELFEDEAPHAVTNFIDLASKKNYYNGMAVDEIHGNVALRIGDPRTRAGGPKEEADGPPWRLKSDASSRAPLLGRMVTLPLSDGGQHGSQFLLTLAPLTHDMRGAAVFGKVTSGRDVLLSLEKDDRVLEVEIVRKRSHPYDPTHSRQS